MRRSCHFTKSETVFAHFKETVSPMKMKSWTRNDFIWKELILCKETILSRTENKGSGIVLLRIWKPKLAELYNDNKPAN